MLRKTFVLSVLMIALLVVLAITGSQADCPCNKVQTVGVDITDVYDEQPYFVTFLPMTCQNTLIDSVCFTSFPLMDKPRKYQVFLSTVYCDGSSSITTYMSSQNGEAIILASPFVTLADFIIDSKDYQQLVIYRCEVFGGTGDPIILGVSTINRPISSDDFTSALEVVQANGLPDLDYYLLPMKLPSQCVTQPVCLQPPSPFYNRVDYTLGCNNK